MIHATHQHQRDTAGPARRAKAKTKQRPGARLHGLVDRLGNRGLKALRGRVLQRKAEAAGVSVPEDPLEMLADRVAEQVVAEPAAAVGPAPPPVGEPALATAVQRDALTEAGAIRSDSMPGTPGPPAAARSPRPGGGPSPHGAMASGLLSGLDSGSPIPRDVRRFMEGRFGRSFEDVRVHTGDQAAEAAGSVTAKAFTIGSEIVFGAGRWAPETHEGKRLLAHELAHVVQQGADTGGPAPGSVAEVEAERAGHDVTEGRVAEVSARAIPGAVQLDPEGTGWKPVPPGRARGPSRLTFTARGIPAFSLEYWDRPVPFVADMNAWERVWQDSSDKRPDLWFEVKIASGDQPDATRDQGGPWRHKTIIVTQGAITPPQPKPKPPVQPHKPKPQPEIRPTAPEPEPIETSRSEQGIRQTPTDRAKEALVKSPANALAIAGQMSDAELEKIDTDIRVALLEAAASDPEAARDNFDAVKRLLYTTPDMEAGVVEDRLNAENEKLRVELAATAPQQGGWMALQMAIMDLGFRRPDKFKNLQPLRKLDLDFESALKYGPLPRGFQPPPSEPQETVGLEQFKPVPRVFVGDKYSRFRDVRIEKNGRGDTRYTYPDGTTATYDLQGRRLDHHIPGSTRMEHEIGVAIELAQTDGFRFVPGKGWLDEERWFQHVRNLADAAEPDAMRQVSNLQEYVQAWNVSQEGLAYFASVPSHVLGGRKLGEADEIAADTDRSVKHALNLMRKARTPGELARAQQSLAFATGHGQRAFYELREDVYGGAENTIFAIKIGAVVATGAAALAYAGGIAVTTIGGKVVVGLLTPLGTSALTANQAGLLEMAHKGDSWENYGEGAAWGSEVGFSMGTAFSIGKFVPLGGSGYGSQLLRGAVGEGAGSGLGSAGQVWMQGGTNEEVWKTGFEEGALGFVGGGMPSVVTDVGLSWATSTSEEDFKRRLLSLGASKVGARMGGRSRGAPPDAPNGRRWRGQFGELLGRTGLGLEVIRGQPPTHFRIDAADAPVTLVLGPNGEPLARFPVGGDVRPSPSEFVGPQFGNSGLRPDLPITVRVETEAAHTGTVFDRAFAPGARIESGDPTLLSRARQTRSGRRMISFGTDERPDSGGLATPLTPAQRRATKVVHGKTMSRKLRRIWRGAHNNQARSDMGRVKRLLNQGRNTEAYVLAVATYEKHQRRFWAAIRRDQTLVRRFEAAGMTFDGASGAPVYRLADGTVARLTLEHSTRKSDNPALAVDPRNLQFVLDDENSYNLEQLRARDPFQTENLVPIFSFRLPD